MLPKLDRILAAIDLSPASERVLAHAVAVGRGVGAAVHVLHVDEPASAFGRAEVAHVLGPEGMRRHEEAVIQALRTQFEDRLAGFCRDVLDGAPREQVFAGWDLVRGRPSRAILETAERLDVQLVVAGLQGHGTLHELMVGSVAHQLVSQTRRALVLVPLGAPGGT